jgi:uncharacterized protein (UPF0216 family)
MILFKSNDPLERAIGAVLTREIQRLNTHLPKRREPMTELLKRTDPTVEAVDGSSILLRTAELQDLARIVPFEYRDRVRLPIIVLRRMDLGKSTYIVAGELVEEFTVKKILNITTANYQEMYKDRTSLFLYRPQLVELIQKYHSLFVVGFGVPRELSDYAPNRD